MEKFNIINHYCSSPLRNFNQIGLTKVKNYGELPLTERDSFLRTGDTQRVTSSIDGIIQQFDYQISNMTGGRSGRNNSTTLLVIVVEQERYNFLGDCAYERHISQSNFQAESDGTIITMKVPKKQTTDEETTLLL